MEKAKEIKKTVTLEELFEMMQNFFKNDYENTEGCINILFTKEGYYTVFQRVPGFGFIIGMPGIGVMPAITFTQLTDFDIDDLDELFKKLSEMVDEKYNPEELYTEQIIITEE